MTTFLSRHKRTIKCTIAVHGAIVCLWLLITYRTVSPELGELWILVFYYIDTPVMCLLEYSLPSLFEQNDKYATPEPRKTIAVLLLFVCGSAQWVIATVGARVLWGKLHRAGAPTATSLNVRKRNT